jgi:hypothetical protein
VQLGFEPAEGAATFDGPRQPATGAVVADPLGELGHVLVPDVGRQWVDADPVQLVEIDRVLPVDAGLGRPDGDVQMVTSPVFGLISHRCS